MEAAPVSDHRSALILNETDPRAPALVCSCGEWEHRFTREWGDAEHNEALALFQVHAVAGPRPEQLQWEAVALFQAASAGQQLVPPEPDGGEPWEPFSVVPDVRADVPGLLIGWRRGGPQIDVMLS